MITPEYIFESSWEVCNKVGGIYTVLSTKAYTLQEKFTDKVIFIGPDLGHMPADFTEDMTLFTSWRDALVKEEHLKIRIGRWKVPGTPPVLLVDYKLFLNKKNALYYSMWESFGVDSSKAYGDYDDSCLFAYAVGKAIESFHNHYRLQKKKVIAHFNEWMLGMGALYVKKHLPGIATVFTTHATSIGRSIAGNGKPLYAYMNEYNGDQMAKELHMEAKHSVEKQAARHVDCFTTVSEITAYECKQLLEKEALVTPNGFEPNFVPVGKEYETKRREARDTLINVAEKLCGCTLSPDTFLIATGGRYEYRNKGIDVFISSMNALRTGGELERDAVAFLMVPGWVKAARSDLNELINKDIRQDHPLQMPFATHWLNRMEEDRIINYIRQLGFTNTSTDRLKIIFVPCYLNGEDGLFNKSYYDLLIGMDATVFPSYYEPWGYTPLESIAFGIPTITTDLSGFGLWAKSIVSGYNIDDGVSVIDRTDFNYFDVVNHITKDLLSLSKDQAQAGQIRKRCFDLASKAEWKEFILYYYQAFDTALSNTRKRNKRETVVVS
ncbi:glycogen/starch synthase [Parabacteroides sp. Marseille-P3160]|uniref:glycogen/starch synthase n=1 Tax=Parabacteroides sp. Marseille-P3160 TaxID=1917887 RepID=UPI0009BAFE7C|nr:glycogen/starch synthase [Parabacteroides sp. Marseille-P3160]